MQVQDFSRRNAEIDGVRGMLFAALADYSNPHLTPQPKSILISLIFSAFQRTFAISPQFIAGRESNTKPRF
ncbi:hypothetical protein [Nostoc sp.]|uniref:hypothetical protein n=1 Tax=Nostoc sp. TaxID=1180 RepID=UPI002FF5C02E